MAQFLILMMKTNEPVKDTHSDVASLITSETLVPHSTFTSLMILL